MKLYNIIGANQSVEPLDGTTYTSEKILGRSFDPASIHKYTTLKRTDNIYRTEFDFYELEEINVDGYILLEREDSGEVSTMGIFDSMEDLEMHLMCMEALKYEEGIKNDRFIIAKI